MAIAIDVEALSKVFRGRQAVADFSLTVPAGQVLALLGPSGAGKTVLLNMLAGLLRPDAGTARVNGYSLAGQREQALQQVTVLVQGADPSSEEDRPPPAQSRMEPLLREMGLWEHRDTPSGELSHGMRRRATLARTLARDRPILLLDEPLAGLDQRGAGTVRSWIRQLAHEEGRTVVVATCCPQVAQELGDRVVVIKCGRLVADIMLDRTMCLDRPAYYRIKVKEGLDARWTAWFDGLTVTAVEGETIISGIVVDQPALHSLLTRIRDLGLPLISVQRLQPGIEDALG